MRSIYILDDEPEVCNIITQIATAAGYSTRSFADVISMEIALTEALPDIIVLDLSLGVSDGIDVIRSLANSQYGGSILIVSGREAETIEAVTQIGEQYGLTMLPFLIKPFQFERLTEILDVVPSVRDAGAREGNIEDALRNGYLELWYQPKIDLNSGLVCGAEALIRLRHPEFGILLPSSFLPAPGDPRHGPLANFVMRRSLADWSFFASGELNLKLAINMPISIFETPEFVANLCKYLPNRGDFPGLIVELTEDEVIRDADFAREVAIQLKLHNVEVSIDDFGSGYSTLDRLTTLPFTELKIAREHVDGCSVGQQQYVKCESIVGLAHRCGMIAVAEGVELSGDLQALRRMTCDVAQGRVLGEPMARTKFREWARRNAMRRGLE